MRLCGYNVRVEFALREFRRDDFESLWRIDQQCFAPGIAYSRLELAAYIRLRGSFTLVAEPVADGRGKPGNNGRVEPLPKVLGFIVAQVANVRIRRGRDQDLGQVNLGLG